MANLDNCALCGSRERPSDLHFGIHGKRICDPCEESVFAMFDDPRWAVEYIREQPIAQPRDLWGKPLQPEAA